MAVNSKILNEIINLAEKVAFKNMYSNVASEKALLNPENQNTSLESTLNNAFLVR